MFYLLLIYIVYSDTPPQIAHKDPGIAVAASVVWSKGNKDQVEKLIGPNAEKPEEMRKYDPSTPIHLLFSPCCSCFPRPFRVTSAFIFSWDWTYTTTYKGTVTPSPQMTLENSIQVFLSPPRLPHLTWISLDLH